MPVAPSRSLASVLAPARVRVGLHAADKDDLLRAMVALVDDAPAVRDAARLLEDVRARETLMSTGVGHGLALPHARTPAVVETVAAFATLAEPVAYDALDGEPVRLVLLLAGPEADRRDHVRLLGRVSRLLASADMLAALAAAPDADAVYALFREAEGNL
ncbi:MAG: PTS sugar transporter subunit IIA [Rubricoccaceae bacterium]